MNLKSLIINKNRNEFDLSIQRYLSPSWQLVDASAFESPSSLCFSALAHQVNIRQIGCMQFFIIQNGDKGGGASQMI